MSSKRVSSKRASLSKASTTRGVRAQLCRHRLNDELRINRCCKKGQEGLPTWFAACGNLLLLDDLLLACSV